MDDPYIGEIRLFGGGYAPEGWRFCDGSVLAIAIAEDGALFNLIGTTCGADGRSTFALPDLRGGVPVHQGNGFALGQSVGSEAVTLTQTTLPPHSHDLRASAAVASVGTPTGSLFAETAANSYGAEPTTIAMAAEAVTPQGGASAHEKLAPFLGVNYIICLSGIYPVQA